LGNKKHKHVWETKATHYTGKPSIIKCKVCHKVSLPGKMAGTKMNKGCFGKCHNGQ